MDCLCSSQRLVLLLAQLGHHNEAGLHHVHTTRIGCFSQTSRDQAAALEGWPGTAGNERNQPLPGSPAWHACCSLLPAHMLLQAARKCSQQLLPSLYCLMALCPSHPAQPSIELMLLFQDDLVAQQHW